VVRNTSRFEVVRTALGIAALVASAPVAGALEADINTKLPYNISYTLDPIEVSVAVKGGGSGTYHVYDFFKNEIAKGSVSGSKTFSFKPPRYCWYVVGVESGGDGVARFIGVTPDFKGAHKMVDGVTNRVH